MTFTPTKTHNQFMPAHSAIAESLEYCGHDPLAAIMTDMHHQDKAELEAVLPSLWKNVIPVPDSQSLPTLSLPKETCIFLLSTVYQINTHLESIMNDAAKVKEFFIAMDME